MIQRVVLGVVAVCAALFIGAAVRPGEAASQCSTPQMRAEFSAARSSLDDAMRDMETAWLGGSRYAAAKIAAVDPAEVDRAAAVQREAFWRLQRAKVACGLK